MFDYVIACLDTTYEYESDDYKKNYGKYVNSAGEIMLHFLRTNFS